VTPARQPRPTCPMPAFTCCALRRSASMMARHGLDHRLHPAGGGSRAWLLRLGQQWRCSLASEFIRTSGSIGPLVTPKSLPRGRAPAARSTFAGSTPGVSIDGTRLALAWDAPMEGVERPWFVCPGCGRRCRHMYLRDRVACRQCLRLDYASRHLRRQTPGVGRVERLRRKLGDCERSPRRPCNRGRRRCGAPRGG
jgi:hypothetical protein